jgi:hypothetical protein
VRDPDHRGADHDEEAAPRPAPAGTHAQVEVAEQREPGDERPRLLDVPEPVARPRGLPPQRSGEQAAREQREAHAHDAVHGPVELVGEAARSGSCGGSTRATRWRGGTARSAPRPPASRAFRGAMRFLEHVRRDAAEDHEVEHPAVREADLHRAGRGGLPRGPRAAAATAAATAQKTCRRSQAGVVVTAHPSVANQARKARAPLRRLHRAPAAAGVGGPGGRGGLGPGGTGWSASSPAGSWGGGPGPGNGRETGRFPPARTPGGRRSVRWSRASPGPRPRAPGRGR